MNIGSEKHVLSFGYKHVFSGCDLYFTWRRGGGNFDGFIIFLDTEKKVSGF